MCLVLTHLSGGCVKGASEKGGQCQREASVNERAGLKIWPRLNVLTLPRALHGKNFEIPRSA